MSLCALCLAQGSAIISTTTYSTTVKHCLKEVSSAPLNHKQLDPLLDMRGIEVYRIKDVLSEVKPWKSTPKHRETISVKMVLHIYEKYKNKHRDILDSVLCYWSVLGIFYYFRLSKRAQNVSDEMQPLTSVDSLSFAFVFPSLAFLGAERITMPNSWSAYLCITGIEFV